MNSYLKGYLITELRTKGKLGKLWFYMKIIS